MLNYKMTDEAKRIIHIYWHLAARHKRLVYALLGTVSLATICYQVLPPLFIAMILDKAVSDQAIGSLGIYVGVYAAVLFIGDVVLWRLADYFAWKLEGLVVRGAIEDVLQGKRPVKDVSFDAQQTDKFLNAYIVLADAVIYQIIPLLTAVLAITGVLLFVMPLFAGIFLLLSMTYIVLSPRVTRPTRQFELQHSGLVSKQLAVLHEALQDPTSRNKRVARQVADQAYDSLFALKRVHTRQQLATKTIITIFSVGALCTVVLRDTTAVSWATSFLIIFYTGSVVLQLFTFSNTAVRNCANSVGKAQQILASHYKH